MAQSSKSPRAEKPAKPYPDFPLFPHASGRWCKKIRGKQIYFGPWSDWKGALEKYQEQRDDLHAGRVPRVASDGLNIDALCNRFLNVKMDLREAGEITRRSYDDYYRTCQLIINFFGRSRLVNRRDLATTDFESFRASLAKNRGPVALGNEIGRIRGVFKYAAETGLIPEAILFGPGFKKPSKRVLRIQKAKNGAKMFEAEEIRRILAAADPAMKAMILLGVNCGFGNHDCGSLTLDNLDLAGGWVNFPRPKTGINRRAKLWPETVKAIEAALTGRREPHDVEHARLVFVTKYRGAWAKDTSSSPISAEFRKLLERIDAAAAEKAAKDDTEPPAAKLRRAGRSFYGLRHSFETIGGEGRDQVAVNAVMGHADDSMAGNYRHRVSDERLAEVAEVVRAWLKLAS